MAVKDIIPIKYWIPKLDFTVRLGTSQYFKVMYKIYTDDWNNDTGWTVLREQYLVQPDVTYVGCEISNDNQITLPWNYTNDKLEDNGESHNIRYKDLFGDTADPKVRRAIFFRFMIKETKVNIIIEPYMVNLLGFTQLGANRFIGIKYTSDGHKFHVFGTDYDFPANT